MRGIDFASRSDSTEVAAIPVNLSFPTSAAVSDLPGRRPRLAALPVQARPWDLEQWKSTMYYCAVGCRVAVQSSSNR